jgi:hypothetical protein
MRGGTGAPDESANACVLTGYYSVENTAARIVGFALSFYDGGDRQAYAEEMKAAVAKGFGQAAAACGGALPRVSHETFALALASLDRWAGGG